MQMRMLVLFLLIFRVLIGFDLRCPEGCGKRFSDPDVEEIGLNFKDCLKKIKFLRTNCTPVENPYEVEIFPREIKRYNPIGCRTWSYEHDEETEDEFGSYTFDRDCWDLGFDSSKDQDFIFEQYSDFLSAFSFLNQDLDFLYQNEIKMNEEILEEGKEALQIFSPGTIAFKRMSSDVQYYQKIINRLKKEFEDKRSIIDSTEEKIDLLFGNIYDYCLENHDWGGSYFQKGMRCFYHEDFEASLENISKLIEKTVEKEDLSKDVHFLKGQCLQEMALYHDAVIELTKAIKKDPSNAESYLERASCYFELGQFDLALSDYLSKKEEFKLHIPKDFQPLAFSTGFSIGTIEGISEACEGFIPGLLASMNGLSNLVWTTIQHPIENSTALIFHINQLCQLLKKIDATELAQILVPELYEAISNWDQLENIKRGEQIGYALGKYGINIFSPIASAKGIKYVHTLREIKKANKLCTLEALSKPRSKKDLIKGANAWHKSRSKQLSQVKIEMDKQGKHIRGHRNFESDQLRSILTHSKPEELMRKKAGTGQRLQGRVSEPGFRERVDFDEIIGFFVDEKTKIEIPTTMGIIHYSKKGAHIVPAAPKK